MEERRLEDARAQEEMMEVKVDLYSDELDSDLGDERPLIQDRDPNRVNSSLKVMFEDVIAEPPSVRSFDKVWLWSHALFEVSRLWCYRFISLLLAVPVSLAAGLLFAVLSCLHIWLIMPCVQLLLINMRWIQTVWASMLNVFISPFWTSFGKCCGQVVIHMADNKTR
ncbi:caveolin-2-like [Nematolebias whitei]|uniref:caveolin-2-like n=1 Tax=Nematolebias whitei TaxID=451745 RepID=UPI0018991412|nr:caveolin-2-like [Nematolebias whitei]